MREKIDLNQFREFGDIISDTVVVIKQNFKPLLKSYFVICGLFLLTNILVSAFVNTNRGDASLYTLVGIIEIFFNIVNHTALILVTLSYLAIYKEKGSQAPEVLEVWGYFKYFFFRVFFTNILLSIVIVIGIFLCLVPGIYLSVVFSLVIPIMVFENGNIEYSYKKAFKIIKGNWWFTLGILLIIGIVILMIMAILMVPPIIIYGGSQWLTGKSLGNIAGILQAISINLCQVLWIVPTIALTLLYFSLTEVKEGNSLIDRINMFGKTTPGTDQISSEQY
ncbi:MAG: hypothetical protein JWP37_4095 [Mucilaginibacter sp.]|nr:hypothetical protein [Mucilaginibacter sp.]